MTLHPSETSCAAKRIMSSSISLSGQQGAGCCDDLSHLALTVCCDAQGLQQYKLGLASCCMNANALHNAERRCHRPFNWLHAHLTIAPPCLDVFSMQRPRQQHAIPICGSSLHASVHTHSRSHIQGVLTNKQSGEVKAFRSAWRAQTCSTRT